eukprot:9279898-Karenia_brevis.AAC.1
MSEEVTPNNIHHFIARVTLVHRHLDKQHNNSKYELGRRRKEAKNAALLADTTARSTYKFLKN